MASLYIELKQALLQGLAASEPLVGGETGRRFGGSVGARRVVGGRESNDSSSRWNRDPNARARFKQQAFGAI